jgi:hypothetical protein
MALGNNCPLRTLLLARTLRARRALDRDRSCARADNQLYADGAAALADGLLVNTQLRVLSLAGNLLGDAGAAAVARGLELNHGLRAIDLQRTQLPESDRVACMHPLTRVQITRSVSPVPRRWAAR